MCLADGVVVPADVTDHKVPHKGDPVLFWDKANWQSLCFSHHNAKTNREDRGAWRPT
jgi:5-methylcytosine-specific restriction protein A